MTEILLEKNRSKKLENVTNILPIELEGKTRLVNGDSLHDDFSLMAQYDKERDESNKFRFIFVINPICSNVLFNVKTEAYKVVENSGEKYYKIVSDGGTFTRDGDLNSAPINTTQDIDTLQIIRDTEYSHPSLGNLKYNCGLDIFNNHILRRNAFCHVNKLKTKVTDNKNFNTFADTLRNNKGEEVTDKIYSQPSTGEFFTSPDVTMHLYNADTLMSMKNAFLNRCEEQNGWFGFYNSTDLEIPNAITDNENLSINRVLMDREPCEFIDFFPDRSYYSFIPQWNDVTNKAEKNWDYCITYPYENDEDKLREVWDMTLSSGSTIISGKTCWEKYAERDLGVPLKGIGAIVSGDNKRLLQIRSLTKHNLKVGSIVHLYQYNVSWTPAAPGSSILNPFIDYNVVISGTRGKNIVVESIGDGTGNLQDYVFSVSYDDIIDNYDATKPIYFKRVSNGEECKYYFRKFKKIKNQDNKDLNSTINKVAFGENIYGDDVAQIVFTDDINVEGLTDNLGRPVSELFLTILKRNEGYNTWYYRDETNIVRATDVERSCHFGRITSGLDYSGIGSVKDEPTFCNIHYMNNIKNVDYNTKRSLGDTILQGKGGTSLEVSGVSISNDIFYGDIVEFDKYDCRETVLSEVCHRFNTTQREIFDNRYRDVFQDVISRDDYDVKMQDEDNFIPGVSHFSASTYYLNDYNTVVHSRDDDDDSTLFYGNICPEGYYYKPFYSIKIKKERNVKGLAPAKKLSYSTVEFRGGHEFYITPDEKYDYAIGDTIVFYSSNIKNVFCTIKRIDDGKLYFDIDGYNDDNMYLLPGNAVFVKGLVPQYANLLTHSGYFIWRDLEAPSNITRGEELYDTPFMNGRFYMEKNINFFLRRQDPFGNYGLSVPIGSDVMNQITTYSLNAKTKKIDTSIIEMVEKGMDVCY